MDEFYGQVSKDLEAGNRLCLVTIIKQRGSTPRSQGARFIVYPGGAIWGTIGGGCLEARMMEEAVEALRRGEARLKSFLLTGDQVAESSMICGGDVEVYVEPLSPQDSLTREIYAQAADLVRQGGQGLLVTAIEPGPLAGSDGRKLLLAGEGPELGSINGIPGLGGELRPQASRLAAEAKPRLLIRQELQGSEARCLVEPLAATPEVYIMGGGHVALALAQVLAFLDFTVVVIDDREEFANDRRFPMAQRVLVKDFPTALQDMELGPNAYVVILTRGHLHDKVVLAQALEKETAYVGMIGSRRKRDIIYRTLINEGADPSLIKKVYSPVGVAIGAQSPEEIAVSIAAELVAVRQGVTPPGR